MAIKSKVYRNVSLVFLTRDSAAGASTTLTALAAAGAATITVASIAGIGVGELLRVGEGEEMELVRVHPVTAPAGNTVTLEEVLLKDHANGEAVREQTAYDLGDPTDGGVTVRYQGETFDANVATKRLPLATLNGYISAGADLVLPHLALPNLLHATGMALDEYFGAGTEADPLGLVFDGNEFAGETNMSLIVVGVLMDGTTWRVELWGVDADYTGIDVPLGRGQLAPVPCRFTAGAGGFVGTTAPAWAATADTSLRPGKGKLWDGLVEAGVLTDAAAPAATTVASGGAAGANTVTVADGTGLAADDYVRFGSGDTIEIWQLEAVAGAVLTIRGEFKRAQVAATVVKKLDRTPFAGIAPDGGRLTFGGSVEQLRVADRRLAIGVRPGNATITLRLPTVQLNLSNLARALGIPQAAIAGGRLPITIATLLADTGLHGVYAQGLLLDGTTLWLCAWGPSIDLSSVETTLTNVGQAPALPLTVKPTSALQVLNYAA